MSSCFDERHRLGAGVRLVAPDKVRAYLLLDTVFDKQVKSGLGGAAPTHTSREHLRFVASSGGSWLWKSYHQRHPLQSKPRQRCTDSEGFFVSEMEARKQRGDVLQASGLLLRACRYSLSAWRGLSEAWAEPVGRALPGRTFERKLEKVLQAGVRSLLYSRF